jgi:hypothetical protein
MALRQCQAGGARSCEVYPAVRGCAYIVVGIFDAGVSYGVSGTPEGAIAQARQAGATSWHAPIGGCGN